MSEIPADIDQMPAGKEMDALIAEHVMNWRRDWKSEMWITGRGAMSPLPPFSTHPESQNDPESPKDPDYYLKQMDSKLRERGWGFQWEPFPEGGHFGADFFKVADSVKDHQHVVKHADTRPLAFCRAALEIVKNN